ncbi:AAA family ATPase [Pseudanabaena sp. ABRG5-3]|uniref:AAA family ATPase n=1 Tax=Pseudanabaena sp. ABRG5-3 TaxID=685565 RepID=UPI000DC6D328|nr:ATP-binding protein [Pseudanabaena sp. ABRG5-3]BBC26513.1 ATPase-like [Pseudanabaena sp. ABRG5-3]
MLNRIYIDNFRSLVNFEISFDSINLFLGANGSGKSTVFDAIHKIKVLISGASNLETLFVLADCCRWQISKVQNFEIEVNGNGGIYKYELSVKHDNQQKTAIVYERLWFNNNPLMKFDLGDLYIYNDDYIETSKITEFTPPTSVVSIFAPLHKKSSWFQKYISKFIVIQIVPSLMVSSSDQETFSVSPKMGNYASWYRYLSQDQGKIFEITKILRDVLDKFLSFKFERYSDTDYGLKLVFTSELDDKQTIEYYFDELSDGQRVIIALYTLIYGTQNEDYTLFIDEPENFLALPEVQPWLDQLYDLCSEKKLQAILISHHPKLINFLAADSGYWFERKGNSPVRVKRIKDEDDTGLPISDLVERGWLYDPE